MNNDILISLLISMDSQKTKPLQEYVNTFTEKEKKAYDIAASHLGSSFNIEKSVGFIQWMKKREMNVK